MDPRIPEPMLPDGMELTRTTREFDENTVPKALLRAHQVAAGVWGNLVVTSGSIDFVFEDDPGSRRSLPEGSSQPIPPRRPHHIVITGPACFVVEFYRSASTTL
ncbi:MAG: DUF1971 domain-containing protein [Acidimicrobiia bacterium]|nr:DUF1971 domain-containing protein [Acidimicrobiia bacterium]